MKLSFSDGGWEQFTEWFTNKRILEKINSLIVDIQRNGPLYGIGKPERLRYIDEKTYSRRIDEANRLVYEYDEDSGVLTVMSCKGHYKD
jgi:toxin YoeB